METRKSLQQQQKVGINSKLGKSGRCSVHAYANPCGPVQNVCNKLYAYSTDEGICVE